MKIACLGGGPAGLYFAITMKLRDPAHDITVFERNKPDDTFGWGVVLSDETFENLAKNDPLSAGEIRRHFAYWDDIAVHYRGQKIVSTGHGFSGIGAQEAVAALASSAPAGSASICVSRPRSPAPRSWPRPTIWSSPPTG